MMVIPLIGLGQDSLRGSITKERAWWDVLKYDITVEPDRLSKTIKGQNIITFKVTGHADRMQIDLQQPMNVDEVTLANTPVNAERLGNVYYLTFNSPLKTNEVYLLTVKFSGQPHEAVTPPWDGGWIWKTDESGNPWMTVACQGLGASVWYPCKDHQSDEPDSASLSIITADTLVAVGNGRLKVKENLPANKVKYTWVVDNPINSYNIVPYIGKYVNWTGTFEGEKGTLDLSFWTLQEDEQKARKQFTQVLPMLKCFEYWFGPYPFYEDGYKLVQAPHLGMEHQSAVAYGNKFMNGYLGSDLSGTGWGKKWDFIIIHESGHEWFGNNITTKDIADMWVHEGFTNYSEALFTECEYGKKAGEEYAQGLRKNIKNDKPVTGPYGLNIEGSTDMYPKGAALVHTIRQLIDDDEKFRQLLRGLNKTFYHKTVTAEEVEKYICRESGKDLTKVFEQYLNTTQIPLLEYMIQDGKLTYRWTNCIPGFNMPVKVTAGNTMWLYPTDKWKSTKIKGSSLTVDPNFYVTSSKM